ncbi:VCBS repeat-containing protein [Aquimarina spongiae]|uniref:Repeat domain-containing protein n=1 Tax=Aquimarina spongiae TaxID=570521 RepID=A0A1M6J576_9FLAO|nr:VCBS repeat-containing protein [Aquimarina spongiae]SHJ41843.1 Repeat domain-containing protein [Aquimarina spongiae]
MPHIILSLVFIFSCKRKNNDFLFSYVPHTHTHVDFENTILENDTINVLDFQYCYNGGGVGIGDFNNDNLPDIVFTGNQTSSKIYLNQGNLKFKDISASANFKTNAWINGVSIVDINGDQLDDIYLSVGGPDCLKKQCNNLLFVNTGIDDKGQITFKEQAKVYGLDDGHYSQQTLFFDYDLDGDLDAYIVHNGNTRRDKNIPIPQKYFPNYLQDILLERQSDPKTGQIVYKNVSNTMGILHKGFGLGVALVDFNNDQLPDIYVSNDFITNDLIYINKGKNASGQHLGFEEMHKTILAKQTYNAMGVDIADINNDLLPDIMVLDMLPKDYERQKKMLGSNNYDKFLLSLRNEYTPQYVHNTLQIHNGILNHKVLPASEISFASGVADTDWSWAPLIMDYDNDGNKDIYVTNGYVKDITDLDFINYSDQNNIFGSPQSRKEKLQKFVEQLPGIYLPNVIFQNKDGLHLDNMSQSWIPEKNTYSNGAAYADLDLDGDLDLIVNNINSPASILENHSDQKGQNFIRIQLKGAKFNPKGIGAKVTLWENQNAQFHYQSVVKGYLSSVEPIIHFGLKTNKVDSIQIVWPDGKINRYRTLAANQTITAEYANFQSEIKQKNSSPLFELNAQKLAFKHIENTFNDYLQQPLLTHQFNANGPCIANADLDNNLGDELFIGGSKGHPGQLFSENKEGSYVSIQQFDTKYEDTAVLFLDINNDGAKDLYIGSGGTDAMGDNAFLSDRIYFNTGNGDFSEATVLEKVATNTSCLAATDVNQDGFIDIFVGGGVHFGQYPLAAPSYLIVNQNGKLSESKKITFQDLGIVTDATWANIDNTKEKELIVAGQWMPIKIFSVQKEQVREVPIQWTTADGSPLQTSGWWNCIRTADIDNDGDLDIIAGNQGTNGFIKPSHQQPVYVYKKDHDHNGSIDPVLAQYFGNEGKSSLKPVHTRDDIMKQLVSLKKKYPSYDEFSKATFQELLSIEDLKNETLNAHVFESIYAENIGNQTFVVHALPKICQLSPINDILIEDINQDGYKDALFVGNDYSSEATYGRQDALIGIFLWGTEKGWIPEETRDSGFFVPKQSNHIISAIDRSGKKLVLAPQNNDSIRVFTVNSKPYKPGISQNL